MEFVKNDLSSVLFSTVWFSVKKEFNSMIKKCGFSFVVMIFSSFVFAADMTQMQPSNSTSLNQTQSKDQNQSSNQGQSANNPSSIAPPLSTPEEPMVVHTHTPLTEGPVIVQSPSKSARTVTVEAPVKSEGPVIVQSPSNSNGPLTVQPSVQQTIPQPAQQIIPVAPLQRVLTIDMDGRGDVTDMSLQQGKDALLVLRLGPTEPSHGLGVFTDQGGNHYRIIKGIKDLAGLMNKDSSDINEGEVLYERLRLGYILMNGRIQTVSLSDAKIIAIHVGNATDESNTGMVDAYLISHDNISRIMQEVMWSGYLE
jgi:hypothetical protein